MEVLDAQSLFRYYGPNHLGKVAAFEKGLADYLGVPFALGAANGTAALRLGLAALGVGPGDEVIVPAATFIASVGAIVASPRPARVLRGGRQHAPGPRRIWSGA